MRPLWVISSLLTVALSLVLHAQGPATAVPQRTRLMLGSTERRALREWDDRIRRLSRSGELVRRTVRLDTVMGGDRVHQRYDQYFKGVRVFGSGIVRQEHRGLTESVFGTIHNAINISTDPRLSEQEAIESFDALSDWPLIEGMRPELVVLPRDNGAYVLAWRGHIWTDEGWMHTFVDAASGVVAFQYNDLQTQTAAVGTGTGVLGDRKKISSMASSGRFLADDQLRPPLLITYDMQGNLNRTNFILNGLPPTLNDVASDNDNDWTDPANVDAHTHLGWSYDYIFKRFGRKGLDDNDTPIRAITHPVRRSDAFTASPSVFGTFYLNAFWCGGCGPQQQGMMMFGEGVPPGFPLAGGVYFDYFAGALDIVAHELTHGLTNYSSQLIYLNESGALNEAFSDIMGTSVEFFFHPPGGGEGRADYLSGEDIARPGGFRSMSNPLEYGDPDHYSRLFRGTADNGGVHINSGIANHAFFLAIEGGTNRTSGLSVQGVGAANREQIEKVFYRAFVFMLTPNANFSAARAATIQSARDLYGSNSAAERAVTEAWTAVGVS